MFVYSLGSGLVLTQRGLAWHCIALSACIDRDNIYFQPDPSLQSPFQGPSLSTLPCPDHISVCDIKIKLCCTPHDQVARAPMLTQYIFDGVVPLVLLSSPVNGLPYFESLKQNSGEVGGGGGGDGQDSLTLTRDKSSARIGRLHLISAFNFTFILSYLYTSHHKLRNLHCPICSPLAGT